MSKPVRVWYVEHTYRDNDNYDRSVMVGETVYLREIDAKAAAAQCTADHLLARAKLSNPDLNYSPESWRAEEFEVKQ
jgi:hypothetical protein